MKRYVTMCAIAAALLATTGQKASAWSKVNFGVGLNFSCENANTNWLWGAFKSGPAPYEGGGGYGNAGGCCAPGYGGMGGGFGNGFGGYGEMAPGAAPVIPTQGIAPVPAPAPAPAPVDPKHGVDSTPHAYRPYAPSNIQPVSAFAPAAYFYPSYPTYPTYYWPGR